MATAATFNVQIITDILNKIHNVDTTPLDKVKDKMSEMLQAEAKQESPDVGRVKHLEMMIAAIDELNKSTAQTVKRFQEIESAVGDPDQGPLGAPLYTKAGHAVKEWANEVSKSSVALREKGGVLAQIVLEEEKYGRMQDAKGKGIDGMVEKHRAVIDVIEIRDKIEQRKAAETLKSHGNYANSVKWLVDKENDLRDKGYAHAAELHRKHRLALVATDGKRIADAKTESEILGAIAKNNHDMEAALRAGSQKDIEEFNKRKVSLELRLNNVRAKETKKSTEFEIAEDIRRLKSSTTVEQTKIHQAEVTSKLVSLSSRKQTNEYRAYKKLEGELSRKVEGQKRAEVKATTSVMYRQRLETDRIARQMNRAGMVIVGAFAGIIKEAAKTSVEMMRLQAVTGETYDALSRLSGLLGAFGIQSRTLVAGFAGISKQLITAAEGTSLVAERVREVFATVGIEAKRMRDRHEPIIDTLLKIRQAYQSLEDPAARTFLAHRAFGGSSEQMQPFLEANEETLDNLVKIYRSMPGFTKNSIDAMRDLNAQLEMSKLAFRSVALEIASNLEPLLTRVTSVFVDFTYAVNGLKDRYSGLVKVGTQVALGFGVLLMSIGTLLVSMTFLGRVTTTLAGTKGKLLIQTTKNTAANLGLTASIKGLVIAQKAAIKSTLTLVAAKKAMGVAAATGAVLLGKVLAPLLLIGIPVALLAKRMWNLSVATGEMNAQTARLADGIDRLYRIQYPAHMHETVEAMRDAVHVTAQYADHMRDLQRSIDEQSSYWIAFIGYVGQASEKVAELHEWSNRILALPFRDLFKDEASSVTEILTLPLKKAWDSYSKDANKRRREAQSLVMGDKERVRSQEAILNAAKEIDLTNKDNLDTILAQVDGYGEYIYLVTQDANKAQTKRAEVLEQINGLLAKQLADASLIVTEGRRYDDLLDRISLRKAEGAMTTSEEYLLLQRVREESEKHTHLMDRSVRLKNQLQDLDMNAANFEEERAKLLAGIEKIQQEMLEIQEAEGDNQELYMLNSKDIIKMNERMIVLNRARLETTAKLLVEARNLSEEASIQHGHYQDINSVLQKQNAIVKQIKDEWAGTGQMLAKMLEVIDISSDAVMEEQLRLAHQYSIDALDIQIDRIKKQGDLGATEYQSIAIFEEEKHQLLLQGLSDRYKSVTDAKERQYLAEVEALDKEKAVAQKHREALLKIRDEEGAELSEQQEEDLAVFMRAEEDHAQALAKLEERKNMALSNARRKFQADYLAQERSKHEDDLARAEAIKVLSEERMDALTELGERQAKILQETREREIEAEVERMEFLHEYADARINREQELIRRKEELTRRDFVNLKRTEVLRMELTKQGIAKANAESKRQLQEKFDGEREALQKSLDANLESIEKLRAVYHELSEEKKQLLYDEEKTYKETLVRLEGLEEIHSANQSTLNMKRLNEMKQARLAYADSIVEIEKNMQEQIAKQKAKQYDDLQAIKDMWLDERSLPSDPKELEARIEFPSAKVAKQQIQEFIMLYASLMRAYRDRIQAEEDPVKRLAMLPQFKEFTANMEGYLSKFKVAARKVGVSFQHDIIAPASKDVEAFGSLSHEIFRMFGMMVPEGMELMTIKHGKFWEQGFEKTKLMGKKMVEAVDDDSETTLAKLKSELASFQGMVTNMHTQSLEDWKSYGEGIETEMEKALKKIRVPFQELFDAVGLNVDLSKPSDRQSHRVYGVDATRIEKPWRPTPLLDIAREVQAGVVSGLSQYEMRPAVTINQEHTYNIKTEFDYDELVRRMRRTLQVEATKTRQSGWSNH